MLSIIDEVLIGLVWKLKEGVKWWLTRGQWEEKRVFWGINSPDELHGSTEDERRRVEWSLRGWIQLSFWGFCVFVCRIQPEVNTPKNKHMTSKCYTYAK